MNGSLIVYELDYRSWDDEGINNEVIFNTSRNWDNDLIVGKVCDHNLSDNISEGIDGFWDVHEIADELIKSMIKIKSKNEQSYP